MGYKEITMIAAVSHLCNQDKDVYFEYQGDYKKVVWEDCLMSLRRSDRFYIYEEEYKQIGFKEALKLWLNGHASLFYQLKSNPACEKNKVPLVPPEFAGLPYYFCYAERYFYYIEE